MRRRARWICAAAGAAVCVLAWSAVAGAQPQRAADDPIAAAAVGERFEAASALMGAERFRDAAEAFLALAQEAPDSPLAADALFTAARLFEERLGDPVAARDAYRRVTVRYPDSRTALAAARRVESLAQALGPGDGGAAPLARLNDIMQRFPARSQAESIALAEALLAEYPRWVGAPRAALWLGQVHERAGRLDAARLWYERVLTAWPSSEQEPDALLGAGDVAVAQNRFADAERYYRALPTTDAMSEVTRRTALDRLARARFRDALYSVAFAVFAACVVAMCALLWTAAGGGRAAVRALARPPTEAVFMLPIAVILVAVSFTGHHAIGPAVSVMCAGGLVVTWLSGAGLRAGAAGRWRVVVHAALVVVAIAAIVYIAIHRDQLIDRILATLQFGPDV